MWLVSPCCPVIDPGLGRTSLSVLLINPKVLVNALHRHSSILSNDTHEACCNVADVVVLAEESDMVVDRLACIRLSEQYASVGYQPTSSDTCRS